MAKTPFGDAENRQLAKCYQNIAELPTYNGDAQTQVAMGLNIALQTVVLMFTTAVFVIFYFSCRCKVEDFDLVRLAESVHAQDAGEPQPAGF